MKKASRMLIVVVAIACLFAPEWLLRARRGPPPSEELWLEEARYMLRESAKPFFILKSQAGKQTLVPNRLRSTARAFPLEKGINETRVFVVGESVAQRLSEAALEKSLRQTLRASNVRVVNCGMGAYDSVQTAAVVDEVLRYRPDLLVVLIGNNNGVDAPVGGYGAYRANLLLRRLWSWRLAQNWLATRLRHSLTTVGRQKRFEVGLRRILMAARAERVATVVATLPVNARDFPPPGELPLNQPRFIAGWVALERRRWREAVKLLREALTVRPSEPMTHFALAKSLDAAGAPGAVGEYFAAIEAADGDRCSPTRNALLRRAAAQYGAAVADVDEVIRGQAPGGIPGWESFLDGVHWRRSLDAAVADEVARAAARAPAASAEKRAPRTWATEEASDFSMRAISDALQIGEEIDPPILSERVVAEFSHAAEIDEDALWVKLADPEGAERRLTGNEWTHFQRGRVQPYWGIVQASAAEAYVRRGEDEKGRKLLASASHYPQASPLSEFLIGLSFWRRGRTKEAERRWQSLPETSRERTMARYYKALN